MPEQQYGYGRGGARVPLSEAEVGLNEVKRVLFDFLRTERDVYGPGRSSPFQVLPPPPFVMHGNQWDAFLGDNRQAFQGLARLKTLSPDEFQKSLFKLAHRYLSDYARYPHADQLTPPGQEAGPRQGPVLYSGG